MSQLFSVFSFSGVFFINIFLTCFVRQLRQQAALPVCERVKITWQQSGYGNNNSNNNTVSICGSVCVSISMFAFLLPSLISLYFSSLMFLQRRKRVCVVLHMHLYVFPLHLRACLFVSVGGWC